MHEEVDNSRKAIDGDNNFHPELPAILDVPDQILAALSKSREVLLGVHLMQGFARCDIGRAAVHLQGTCRCDNDCCIRPQTTDPTFDVAKLLHAHVRAESTLSEYVANTVCGIAFFDSSQLEGHAIGENRRVSMCDVCERTGVHEDGGSLDAMVHVEYTITTWANDTRSTCRVCIRFGLMASFMRTARAPDTPRSSAVMGSPCLLGATTMAPSLSRMSARLVESAKTAIHSLATEMSNPASLS